MTAVERARAESDVYFGLALSPEGYGNRQRCTADAVIAVPGVWADVDLGDEGHKQHKKPNPANWEAVRAALDDAEVPAPTIVVASGGGRHVYWLFPEVWQFGTDEERQQGAALAERFQGALRAIFAKHGWNLDATADLSRVLRVPGTFNRKDASNPKPVQLLTADGPRYLREDLEAFCERFDASSTQYVRRTRQESAIAEVMVAEDLELDPHAVVDPDMVLALCDANPKFRESWERKRSRNEFPDQSGSSYDMSLAVLAAQAGLSDQDIIDLLIAHRRKHRDDLKLRLDYYRRTLKRARQTCARGGQTASLDTLTDLHAQLTASGAKLEHEDRAAILRELEELFGFSARILRIVRYPGTNPTFVLETDQGRVHLGGVRGLTRQDQLREHVQAHLRQTLPRFKIKDWEERIVPALLAVLEDEDLGEEATEEGETRGWLCCYLEEYSPEERQADDQPFWKIAESHSGDAPFLLGEHAHISVRSFKEWVQRHYREYALITERTLAMRLEGVGCKHVSKTYTKGNGKRGNRKYWVLPSLFEW
ncbi:MAG: hypothetical protein ACK47B_23545 [Armatimonadota bacterium]